MEEFAILVFDVCYINESVKYYDDFFSKVRERKILSMCEKQSLSGTPPICILKQVAMKQDENSAYHETNSRKLNVRPEQISSHLHCHLSKNLSATLASSSYTCFLCFQQLEEKMSASFS